MTGLVPEQEQEPFRDACLGSWAGVGAVPVSEPGQEQELGLGLGTRTGARAGAGAGAGDQE